MSARSLWLWLHTGAEPGGSAALRPSVARTATSGSAAAIRADAAAVESGADGREAAGEDFQPGVWARAAIGIYS